MAGFSIGEAVGSGFRVIREHPTAVLMWGLAYFVVTMAPMLAVGATMISDFAQLSEVTPSEAPSLEAFMTLQAKMMLLQAVQFVSTVAGAVILYGAIFRVVLEPQDKQHWYLRVGRQEMWLAFAYTVAITLAIMAMFAAMIPGEHSGHGRRDHRWRRRELGRSDRGRHRCLWRMCLGVDPPGVGLSDDLRRTKIQDV